MKKKDADISLSFILIIALVLTLGFVYKDQLLELKDKYVKKENVVVTTEFRATDVIIGGDRNFYVPGDTVTIKFRFNERIKPIVEVNNKKQEVIENNDYYVVNYKVVDQDINNDLVYKVYLEDHIDDAITGELTPNIIKRNTNLRFSKTNVSITKNDKYEYSVYEDNKLISNQLIAWKSNNNNVATVSDGVVTGIAEGTATISATYSGKTIKSNVTVKKNVIDVTSISILSGNTSLYVGESVNLQYSITPNNATNKNVTWKSSNTNVATVKDGIVKAVGEGNSTITVTSNNGKTSSIIVTVKKVQNPSVPSDVEVSSILIINKVSNLYVGDSYSISVSIVPSNAKDKTVKWSSSDTSVATVSNGTVRALKEGMTTITATSSNGLKDSFTFSVKSKVVNAEVETVSITNGISEMNVGETYTLNTSIVPSNATNKNITWSSSDTSVATVSNGVVKALKEGNVVITATSSNGKKDSVSITVKKVNTNIDADSVHITNKISSLYVSEAYTFYTQITPSDTTNRLLSWTSSDTSVATVTNGVVMALKNGSTTITVSTSNGKKDSVTVTVSTKNVSVDVTSVAITNKKTSMYVGDSYTLTTSIMPSNATNKNITWTSSNSNVATVTNGVVKAVSSGTATITATSSNGKKDSVTITVSNRTIPVESVVISGGSSVNIGSTITLTSLVLPDNASDKKVTWTSSNTAIATINNGVVKGIKEGSVTITATAGNLKATKKITVKKIAVTSIALSRSRVIMNVGETATVKTIVTPSNATYKTVSSSSNNTSIVTANKENITAVNTGTAKVTMQVDGVKKEIEVVVLPKGDKIHFLDTQDPYTDTNGNYVREGGDCILIESTKNGKKEFALVDMGYAKYEPRISDYLNSVGVTELSWVLITHFHNDHFGAYNKILQKTPAKKIYYKEYSYASSVIDTKYSGVKLSPEELKQAIEESRNGREKNYNKFLTNLDKLHSTTGLELVPLTQYAKKNGVTKINLTLGNFTMDLYNLYNVFEGKKDVCAEQKSACNENTNSAVMIGKINGKTFYLGGDLDNYTSYIIKNGNGSKDYIYNTVKNAMSGSNVSRIDIFKANHHGIIGNNPYLFLNQVNPQYGVVTSGGISDDFKNMVLNGVDKNGNALNFKISASKLFATGDANTIFNVDSSKNITVHKILAQN